MMIESVFETEFGLVKYVICFGMWCVVFDDCIKGLILSTLLIIQSEKKDIHVEIA